MKKRYVVKLLGATYCVVNEDTGVAIVRFDDKALADKACQQLNEPRKGKGK